MNGSARRQTGRVWQRMRDAVNQYRNEPLSDIELALIRDVLAHSQWVALWLLMLFGLAGLAVWGHVPTLWLLLFMVLFGIEVAIKISIAQHFEVLPPERQKAAIWRMVFDAGSLYSGVVYGMAALVLLLPMPEVNRWLLVGVFCALVSGLSAAITLFTPIARIMLPCLMAPLTVALLSSGNTLLVLLGLLCIAAIGSSIGLANLSQGRYRHFSRLNRENQALVASLSEQQRIAAKQQVRAEQALIDKSRFLAIASHDLRQPLHAIGLFHHALRLKSENDGNRQLFESIDKSTVALNAMFDSLLDVSKLDANVMQPEFAPVELDGLCSVLKQEFAPVAREKGLDLQCELAPARIITDGTLLARILRNLISNAIKFTEHGAVRLFSQVEGSELCIQISDTGPGIPPAERHKVFSEFYQLGSGERFGTVGVGLGLSIVRRLCELLDIRIHLDASPSGGTRVNLRMKCQPVTVQDRVASTGPVASASESAMVDENGDARPRAATATVERPSRSGSVDKEPGGHSTSNDSMTIEGCTTALEGRSILLLDDDWQICQAMGDTLKQWGCMAICEPDVTSALQRLDVLSIDVDLMIVDYQLADDNNGIDAIATLRRALGREIPAILVSGVCEDEATRLMALSGFKCLTKPVAVETLYAIILEMTAGEIAAKAIQPSKRESRAPQATR